MRRFAMLSAAAAVAFGAYAAPVQAAPFNPNVTNVTFSRNLVPSAGALWGAYPNEPSGMAGLEAKVGRRLAIYIKYEPWTFAHWSDFKAPVDSGRLPIISWSAAKTTTAAAIANGSQDKIILAAANQLKAIGKPLFLRPFYEFDQPAGHPRNIGSPASVIAAWRHTYTLFRSVGATNVRFVWSPMAFDFAKGIAQQYWPGASYVNWIGPDGYNFPGAAWHDWPTIFGPAYAFSVAQSRPMMIPETASPVNDSRTPPWITQGAVWIADHPNVKAVTWFDAVSPKGYNFEVTTNAATLAAFKAWGQRSYFQVFAP